jgi:hypothetical protein
MTATSCNRAAFDQLATPEEAHRARQFGASEDFFGAFYGAEKGRIDPTAWPFVTADHERGADLCDVAPIGYVP